MLLLKAVGYLDIPQLMEFNQSEFFDGFPALVSMDTIGYVYVPTPCQSGTGMRFVIIKYNVSSYFVSSLSTAYCTAWLQARQASYTKTLGANRLMGHT